MERDKITDFLQRNWRAIFIVATVILVTYIIGQFGFISVNATSYKSTTGDYNFYITNNSDGSTSQATSKSPNIKKLVHRGSYTVTTTQGETSSFTITKTGGFFLSKKVVANLEPEKARNFVGDNPDACTTYLDNTLLSFSCNGNSKTLKVHRPATATSSTYVDTTNSDGNTIEGIVKSSEGTVVLASAISTEGPISPQLLTTMDKNGSLSINGKYISGLTSSKPYHLGLYKDGYAVFDENMSDVVYLPTINSSPTKVSFQNPKNTKINPYQFATTKESIIAAYTSDLEKSVRDNNKIGVTTGSTTISVYKDGKNNNTDVPGVFSSMTGCGTQKLCAISNKNLLVYDISGKHAKFLYSIPNVQGIANNGNKLIVATYVNLLSLDVDKQSGSVAYSYGEYSFCGLTGDRDGYTLCVINPLQRKSALRFDPNSENSTSIDKKILELQKSTAVKLVSAYQNYIYVVPNYGEVVQGSSGFNYDPVVVKRMNNTLSEDLAKSGIDTKTYTVTGASNP